MRSTVVVLAALLVAPVAGAGDLEVHGHAKVQSSLRLFEDDDLGAVFSGHTSRETRFELRFAATWRSGRWDVTADPQVLALGSDAVKAAADPETGVFAGSILGIPEPSDGTQWLDLSHTLTTSDSSLAFVRLDRLSVGYTGDRFVARLGRQALSWGGGLVFQVLDLFNPFPPTVIDTDYKPGTDMLSTQWLLKGGDDLQAIVVPRRAEPGRGVVVDASSLAVKWHHFGAATELELMAAKHYEDTVVGAGISGNLAGGVVRANLTYTALEEGGGATSLLANLDHSWVWGGRNAYGFVEFFHNGFGVSNLDRDYTSLPAPLLDRLARGELFNAGADELASGLQFEWTPRLRFDPIVLVNLADESSMVLLHVGFDWVTDLQLDFGLQAPLGPRGTEYGGIPVSDPNAYAASGSLLWIRLARYF